MSSILLLRIASLHKFCFVLECFHIRSCCSIFNDQPRPHPFRCDSLYIIPQSFPFVNTFFKSFFTFFKVFFGTLRAILLPFRTAYILYHFTPTLSIPFLKVFSLFLIFFQICYWYPSLLATCDIITCIFVLVKYIFCVFCPFYAFLAFCPKYIRQNGRLFCKKVQHVANMCQKPRKTFCFLPIIYAYAGGLFFAPMFQM